MRSATHGLRLSLAPSVAILAMLATAGVAHAQERAACARSASEILDPFEAMPRARAAGAVIGELVSELLDPFEGAVRSAPARIVSELVDPFTPPRAVAVGRSELLDPWSG